MTTCLHFNKNGSACGNKKLTGSNYCYLKSHYPSLEDYEEISKKIYQHYLTKTIDHNIYTVTDVIGDGACLYRCFALHLLKNLDLLAKVNEEVYLDYMKMINQYFKLKLEDDNIEIKNWSSEEYQIKIQDIIKQKMLETNYLFVNKLSKYLQVKIKDWLVEHKNLSIEELGGFTLESLVENCHDISLNSSRYKISLFGSVTMTKYGIVADSV